MHMICALSSHTRGSGGDTPKTTIQTDLCPRPVCARIAPWAPFKKDAHIASYRWDVLGAVHRVPDLSKPDL